MAWTNPTTRSSGDTITAGIWNADLVDNLLYLYRTNSIISGGYVTRSGTNLLFAPDQSNHVRCLEGGYWVTKTIPDAGVTVACTGLSNNTDYYLYVYDSSGTMTLELSTTAPTTSNGIYVKTAETQKTLVARCRSNGSGAITTYVQDASTQLVCNIYNQRYIELFKGESTNNWNYNNTDVFRAANGSAANKIALVSDGKSMTWARVCAVANQSVAAYTVVGVGLDSTTTDSSQARFSSAIIGYNTGMAFYSAVLSAGFHELTWLEKSYGGGTTQFVGDDGIADKVQTGISAGGWF